MATATTLDQYIGNLLNVLSEFDKPREHDTADPHTLIVAFADTHSMITGLNKSVMSAINPMLKILSILLGMRGPADPSCSIVYQVNGNTLSLTISEIQDKMKFYEALVPPDTK